MSKIYPSTLSTSSKSSVSRRDFIQRMMIVGLALNIPLYNACTDTSTHSNLSNKQERIIKRVFQILFPKDKTRPSADDIKVFHYFLWVLEDPNLDPDESQYVIRGIKWLNETSDEEYETDFTKLDSSQQEDLIQFISETSWGESWLSTLLTLLFEALLLDPIYRLNEGEKGLKWLAHQEGNPRPTKQNSYPIILERKKEQTIISNLNQL